MPQDKLRASQLSANTLLHLDFFLFLQWLICASPFPSTPSKLTSVCVLLIWGVQGDVLTVVRRLDEHWIEARLGEKVGVCPLQFTEVSPSSLSLSSVFPLCSNAGCGLFSVIKVDTCRLALCSDGAAPVMNWSIDVVAGCH